MWLIIVFIVLVWIFYPSSKTKKNEIPDPTVTFNDDNDVMHKK